MIVKTNIVVSVPTDLLPAFQEFMDGQAYLQTNIVKDVVVLTKDSMNHYKQIATY